MFIKCNKTTFRKAVNIKKTAYKAEDPSLVSVFFELLIEEGQEVYFSHTDGEDKSARGDIHVLGAIGRSLAAITAGNRLGYRAGVEG